MSMRAAVYGPSGLTLETVPIPGILPGDLLLRVLAASICATDLKIIAHGHFKIPAGTRRVLGHELAGEVVTASAHVPDLPFGARVGVAPNVGCGRCELCVQGRDQLCPQYEAIGITLDGALAEYVRIPAAAVRRGHVVGLPSSVDDDEAALIEPMSCVVSAHEAVGTGWGDRVLIFGAGPMGLMHVLLSRAAGAGTVVAVEPDDYRRQQVLRFGADGAVTPGELDAAVSRYTADRGFDVVIVAVPAREALEQAPLATAVTGRINIFAGLARGAAPPVIDANAVHYRQLLITGTTGSSVRQYRRTADLVAAGRLALASLISDRLPLDDVQDAVARAGQREVRKVVVVPHGVSAGRE